jgi:hypothetical protein
MVPVLIQETAMSKSYDGPKMGSQSFIWRPEAFQGKAYPTGRSLEEAQRDQRRLDDEVATRVSMRAVTEEKIDRLNRDEHARLVRRRREKRGR